MTQRNQFVISNGQSKRLILVVEPEATEVLLAKDDEVVVFDTFINEPVMIQFSSTEAGEPVLSVLPGDGDVKVEKNGVDVLELAQIAINARSA